MQNKARRLQALLHVIQTRDVGTQDELQAILEARGFDVDVATISRDIRELGIVKAPAKDRGGRSTYKYVLRGDGIHTRRGLDQAVKDFVESITVATNFLVIKTKPQCAELVASEIDKAAWAEILGTIASDDTIVGICESASATAKASSRLTTLKNLGSRGV